MIRWCSIAVALIWTIALHGQDDKHRNFLPPYHFSVDSVSLVATWQSPKIVFLEEDFESDTFPPSGWAATSLGIGWMGVESPEYNYWIVPEHSGSFALINDDFNWGYDGSLDYLVTPLMDLTVADSFQLFFDSYFDGAYGQRAFLEYSLDSGSSWQLLQQIDAGLKWESLEIDLSEFSGTEGESDIQFAFHADDYGYWASGWAIDNVVVYSNENPQELISYKVFLDSELVGQVNETYYQYSFEYTTTHNCGVLAQYEGSVSDTVSQTVTSAFFPKPDSLEGSAPDDEAILVWDPPLVSWEERLPEDSRDFGDILQQFSAPSPISMCWGICDDGMDLWITDPNTSATSIYQVNYDGLMTGNIITISQGQSWIGDMVSDGEYLYGCLVGGPNSIVKVEIATGETVGTIDGDFTITSQHGLAADFCNEEFYIGGWNSNQIWRITFDGTTISTFGFTGVSGLTWHPTGGPEAEGSLWVVACESNSLVTELDPNFGWGTLQSLPVPGGEPFSGAGIEIKPGGANCGSLWICNQIENMIYLVDVDEPLAVPCTNEVSVPDNLIGFNIYRNGEYRATVNCTEPECCYYIDPIDFSEGTYFEYEVTALYDLSEYGLPGEIGESVKEGTAQVTSCCWNELDFFEDWGYYTYNYWKFSGNNWKIDPELGNEVPAAVFSPDSTLFQYKDSLQTYLIMTFGMPVDIILDYDISLSSVISSGEEKLLVQVNDFINNTWNTVMSYDNNEGGFGWRRDTINITGAFNGIGFRIRFNAVGENSADINNWAVDNIAVRREYYPPVNVIATFSPSSEDSILVRWEEPLPEIADWRHWDDGDMSSQLGIGVGKSHWFSCAARWTPDQLSALKGGTLTSVGFIPTEGGTFYKIAVWTGENISPVYTQAAGNLDMFNWNYIELDQPIQIDITRDLIVGYQYSQSTGFSMSVDDGPAVDGYGNLVQLGLNQPWETLLEANPDLNYNWNIKAYFERDGVPADSYQLFRSLDGNEPEMIAEVEYLEYIDTISSGFNVSCYKLKSVFWDEYESDFSEEACVVLVNTDPVELKNDGFLKIFPNPATDLIHVQSSEKIQSISIFDARGDKVIWWEGDMVEMGIPVKVLLPGLYMVKLETGGGIVSRKVVIRR